jgi:hypothetical protein
LGPVEGSCERGNKPSGSIKCWDVLEWLRNLRFSRRAQLHEVSLVNLKGRDLLRNPGVEAEIVSKRTLKLSLGALEWEPTGGYGGSI